MEIQTFPDQGNPDDEQKAQRQDLEGWVPGDKFTDRFGGQEHHPNGNNHCSVHDPDLLDHPDSRDDGVNGKYDIQ